MPEHGQLFTSPIDKWAVQPTFVVGEYLFILCAGLALVHALSFERAERRKHLMVWVGALVAGTANDVIFMALPLVDNFWQAQATIMITPRLPLYIPCVYVWFMYVPTVAVWRLGLPPWSRAALTGIAAILIYAPYDILGAKFLWWTWHDTDRPIENRLLGAPIGSTMWVIAFVATFAWLLGRVADRDPEMSNRTIAKGLAAVTLLTTVVMVLQLTLLQQLDGGVPGIRGLVVQIALHTAIAIYGFRHRARAPQKRSDQKLLLAICGYFLTLTLLMAAFRPETHRSTSLHQTVGRCYVEATDITGTTRYAYLCVRDFDEDFSFDCVADRPADGARWYTVCGRPHQSRWRFMAAIALLGGLGALLYTFMLSPRLKTVDG